MTRIRDRHVGIAALILALAMASCSGSKGGGSSGTPEETYPPTYAGKKIIFLTHMQDTANLFGWMSQCSGRSTGVEAADCICQQHAQLWGNLSGTYKAWLSDSKQSAAARLTHATVPYVNRRGEQLAADWTGLATAPCSDLMKYDEEGMLLSDTSMLVWTGSDSAGNMVMDTYYNVPGTCSDWTSEKSYNSGFVGQAGFDEGSWWPNFPGCWSEWTETSNHTPGGKRACDDWNHLYCVEQ